MSEKWMASAKQYHRERRQRRMVTNIIALIWTVIIVTPIFLIVLLFK